jgi:copper resistance protein B
MRNQLIRAVLPLCLALTTGPVFAAKEDDPVLSMVKVDQLETRDTDNGSLTAWSGHLWIGKDLHKLWIKTEGEHSSEGTESAELQVLYSRAIDANWDLQVGLRHDAQPEPQRNWAVIGFNGVSPYWFEIDSALFIEEDGQANLRFKAEYEIMFTQKWVLSPEIEVDWFSEDDAELGIGSGLARLEAGLRLRYEISRQFAPYAGVNYERLLGDTEDIAASAGADTSETQLVAGLRFWF